MALIVSRSPLQTSEVLSLLLEPPADSISVYRPVKCTAEEKCKAMHRAFCLPPKYEKCIFTTGDKWCIALHLFRHASFILIQQRTKLLIRAVCTNPFLL